MKTKEQIEVRPINICSLDTKKVQITIGLTNLFLTKKEVKMLKKQIKKCLKVLKSWGLNE